MPSAASPNTASRLAALFSGSKDSELANVDSDQARAFEQWQVGAQRGDPSRKADDQMPPVPRQRPERWLGRLAADRIEDDIDALAAVRRLDLIAPVVATRIDDRIGAARGRECALSFARRRSDHARA